VRMMSVRTSVALVMTIAMGGCDALPDTVVTLEPVRSVEGVSLTDHYDVVGFPDGLACIIVSYESRVECGTTWPAEIRIGSEGDGPVEFRGLGALVRASSTSVGVVDWRQGRLAMFDLADGSLQHEVRVPGLFIPFGHPRDGVLVGGGACYARSCDALAYWIDLVAESVESRSLGIAVPRLLVGVRDSDSTVVVRLDGYELARLRNDGLLLRSFTSPHYEPEPLTSRELKEWAEGVSRLGGGVEVTQAEIEEKAAEPKPPIVPGSWLRVDKAGRTWVATTHDWSEWTYFDVFDADGGVARIRVPFRVRAFDIVDSMLVTLAERSSETVTGLYPLGLDWYVVPN